MSAIEVEDVAVELVLDAQAQVGEGPVWDDQSETLVWVDIMGHLVHRYNPRTQQDSVVDIGQPVGAAVPRRSAQGLILALRDGFGVLDEASGKVDLVAPVEIDVPSNRMNDGKCDPAGRFWAGTMAFAQTPRVAALYRLDPGFRVTRMLDEVTLSNGLGWSPDGRRMYYIDSTTQGVDVFEFEPESSRLGERRRLISIAPAEGLPDGLTVDAEGALWVALHGSGTIRRYTPEGRLERAIGVPPSMVTCCAFGGPDLRDLYITTMRLGLSDQGRRAQPLAGGLFRCRPGLQGLPPHRFAG